MTNQLSREAPQCKNCNKGFNTWTYEASCDHCDEFGQVESTRDFGWDKDGMMNCPNCNGTKEIKTARNDFCSEECIDEYFANN